LLLSILVDFSGAAQAVIDQLSKQQKLAVKVKGATTSHFFPPGATLRDVEVEAGGLKLAGTDLTLEFTWGALFGDAVPVAILFERGSVTMQAHAGPLPPPPAMMSFKGVRMPMLEHQAGADAAPSSLDMTLRPEVPGGTASKTYISAGWRANGIEWQLEGTLDRWPGAEASPYHLTLKEKGGEVKLNGTVQVDEMGWGWKGDADLQSNNVWAALKAIRPFWAQEGLAGLPHGHIAAKGGFLVHGGHVKLSDWQWSAGNDKGSLNLELNPEGQAEDGKPVMQAGTMQVHFEHLTLDGWVPIFGQPEAAGISLVLDALQAQARAGAADSGTEEYYSSSHTMLPANVRLNIEVEVAKLVLNGQELPGLSAQAELADASLTLHQLQAGAPGDGRLGFSGVLKPTQDSWQFGGAVDVSSRSFRQVIAMLGKKPDAIAEPMFGPFAMRANVAIEPGQVRLTEVEGSLDKSQYRGAFIFHLPKSEEGRLKLEASWVADAIDLDAYFPPTDWGTIGADDAAVGGSIPAWLNDVAVDVAMQCRVGALNWRATAWGDSQARFSLAPGTLDVPIVRANPAGNPVEGKFTLSAQPLRPKLDLTLKASGPVDVAQLRTLIAGRPAPAEEDEPPEAEVSWSEATMDTGWLSMMDGALDVFLSRLNMPRIGEVDNLRMKAGLASRVLSIDAAQADMLGGRVAFKGQLTGGSLPSLSASFQTQNVRIARLLTLKLQDVHADGALSMQGNVRTQGISPASWVASLTSNIRFAVDGMRIDGFDLDAIGRRVLVTRSATDVSNLARLALEGGSSSIRRLEGNMAIQQGVAEFVGVTLSTDAIGGGLQGKTDLPRMLTNNRFTFTPQTTRDDPPPAIHFDVKGPLLAPEKQLETSDLEAYIAKQSVKPVE
jgi:hypothetical protein